jgi:hypothetical protein
MGLRVGRHNFGFVTYDASSDVIYAKVDGSPSARREATPEEHVWLFDEDDRFHGVALMEPRERLERDGAVYVTLPSGEHERVAGVEFAVRAGASGSGTG